MPSESVELRRLLRRLRVIRQSLRASLLTPASEEGGALSSYDNHPADDASTTLRRETTLGLERGLSARLGEVERALEKWKEGTYGFCDGCGAPIPADRLQARPESVRCIVCAREEASVRAHRDHWRHGRPGDMSGPAGEPVDVTREMERWGSSDTPQDVPPAVDYESLDGGWEADLGAVEDVEGAVDATGTPMLDETRQRPRRMGAALAREATEGPSRKPPAD